MSKFLMGVGVGVGVGLVGKWLYDTWQESQDSDYHTVSSDETAHNGWQAQDEQDVSAGFQAQTDESLNANVDATLNTHTNQLHTDAETQATTSVIMPTGVSNAQSALAASA